MMEVGRLCTKIAGRDSGKVCVIVDIMDSNHVLIDGETRRRKCNIIHLDPQASTIELTQGADHALVVEEFKKLGIELTETTKKEAKPRPRKVRGSEKAELVDKSKKGKAAAKKEDKPKIEAKVESKEVAETKLEKAIDQE
ncbi:50S ribosomal protein L14e [Candidatus Woesearchaeota archaeon]|jgi:large subunit ribosomal protein L14e|nr:50S ribosomal protein L14e [Candidatus Woesearchaeota archaeon]